MKKKHILEIVKGSTSYSVEISLNKGIIGRGPKSDIRIPFSTISSSHLEFQKRAEGFFFRDLGSTNGTFLGGQKIVPLEWIKIDHEITLNIVDTVLIFRSEFNEVAHFTMVQSGTLARKLLMDTVDDGSDAFLEAVSGPNKGVRLVLHDGIEQTELGGATGDFSFPPMTPAVVATIIREGEGFSILPVDTIFIDAFPTRVKSKLSHGDRIEMGKITFLFQDPLEAYFKELANEGEKKEVIAQSEPIVGEIDLEKEAPKSRVMGGPKAKKKKDFFLIFVVLVVVGVAIVVVGAVLSL